MDTEFTPSPTIPQTILRTSTSASTSRFSSEDWVKQADGLTIESPLLPNVQSEVVQEPPHENRQETMEDVMVCHHPFTCCICWTSLRVQSMDSEETMSMYRPQLPVQRPAHRPHAPHIQITTSSVTHPSTQQHYYLHNQHQSSLLSAPQQYTYSSPQTEPPIPQGQAPLIRVLPATPSVSPIAYQDQDTCSKTPRPTSQASPTSAMPISPTNSSSPVTNRKQRFTMGPRFDCEKCRLGVKGHWMHFD